MVSSVGDQYTSYVDTEGTNSFNQLVDGKYNGIGCLIQETEDKKIKVMQVYENTSAYKAGIKVGDIIKKVDDKDSSIGSTELANYIKSSKNKSYSVTVLRDDKEIKFTLSKNEVEIPVVTSKIFDKGDKKIGYISISIFSSVSFFVFNSSFPLDTDSSSLDTDSLSFTISSAVIFSSSGLKLNSLSIDRLSSLQVPTLIP